MADLNNNTSVSTGVLLVNYRQWQLTEKCIKSLLNDGSSNVIIGLVDNDSGEPPPEWMLDHPRIILHMNARNEGLTAGNNKAYELVCSRGVEHVFILNNDTEVAEGTVKVLSDHLQGHPGVGIVAPAISYASEPERIWSAGGKYSRKRMMLRQQFANIYELPDEPVEMEQVTGCAIMMRAADYERSGMQDPDLFVYYEDTDLCFKVRELGLRIMLVPKGRVVHHVSISVGGVYSPFAVYFTHRNRFIVAARHLGHGELLAFFAYYLFVSLYKTMAYPLSGNGNLVGSMWLGFLHGLLNKPEKRPARFFSSRERTCVSP